MKMKRNEMVDLFDQKVAEVFQVDLPEMPHLVEEPEMTIQELDRESLDQLQAAGETLPVDIIRFLKNRK